MTISVVQVSNDSGVFGSGVTEGNSIVLVPLAYEFANATLSFSAPKLGGSAFAGDTPVQEQEVQNTYVASGVVAGSQWLLQDIPAGQAGATTTGITIGGGGTQYGLFAIEINPGGATLTLDQAASGSNGNSENPACGPTGSISVQEIAIGWGVMLGIGLGAPSGWTAIPGPSDFGWVGYEIASSGTFSWSQSSGGDGGPWASGIITLKASGGTSHTATASLTVTPSLSAGRTRGKYRTGSLEVSPSCTAGRARGRFRTGTLEVAPEFSAARTRGTYRSASLAVSPSLTAGRSHGNTRAASLEVSLTMLAARSRGTRRSGSLEVIPSFSAGRVRGAYRSGSLSVDPSFQAGRARRAYRSAALEVSPSFSTARTVARVRTGSLIITPSLSVVRVAGHHRSGALVVVPLLLGTGARVTPAPPAPAIPATGAWYALASVFADRRMEFEWWEDQVVSEGGLACPRDGEPLTTGPSTDAGAMVIKFCRFCGWQAPRDVIQPRHGVRMGRNG